MDQKSMLNKILLHAKAGEFSKGLKLIKQAKLVQQSALNIIIAATNACYYNPEKCEVDKIEELLNTMVNYLVGTFEEKHLTVYFQSIFHIIKLLCKKERFEDLTKLEAVIIPTFLNGFVLEDQKTEHTYIALIKQISQTINHLAVAKNTSYNVHLLQIFKIILKAQTKAGNPKDLLTLAQTCLYQLHHLGAKNELMLNFYDIFLNVFSSEYDKTTECSDTIQTVLVTIFSDTFTDIIQSKDFENASMLLGTIETRIKSNNKKQNYLGTHLMFKAIAALFPCNKDHMQKAMDDAKQMLTTFRISHKKLFYSTVSSLDEPLLQLLSFYRNSGLHVWNQIPETAILHIVKFLIEEITCHSILSLKKCSCGCNLTNNYSGSLKIGCQLAALLKLYVEQSKDLNKEFFVRIRNCLYYFYGIIKKTKEGGCQKWRSFYGDLVCHTYNIFVVLYRSENIAHKEIGLCFLKYSVELEGVRPEIRRIQTITFVLGALCEVEFKNQNFMGAMGYAALHCLLYTQNSNTIFQNWWIRSKMKVKEDTDFQHQTLVSVLYRQIKQLNHIVEVEELLTADKKIELLIFELTRYKAVWRSKVSMMAAFGHLCEIADIPVIAEVILSIYGDGDVQIHNDMSTTFVDLTKRFEAFLQKHPISSNIRLAMAVLHYYHFKTALQEAADKNLKEMETTMRVAESVKEKEDIEPVPKDANDECDIVSAYSSLRLTKFMHILKSLDKCEECISAIMNDNFEPAILKSISKLLAKIGFEYRLHCFSIKSLQAFNMSMRCAQKNSDNEGHLFALSFLIESVDVKKNFVKELIDSGDGLAIILEGDNEKERYSKTLVTYYISKAKAFLYDDPKVSYEGWLKADVLCTANEDKDEFQFLRAELHIVLYKLTKNCDFIPGEHARQPMTLKLHLAFDIVIEMVQKNILTSYELCILFDTVYELTKVYYLMRLPRDLRAYSKHSVLLTQKIILPLRCVSFLLLLAHSDVATCKFDHCTVKLNGINDIFCLNQSRPLMVPIEKPVVEYVAKTLESDIDRCTDLIQELVLDLPQHTRQYSPASPSLLVESFKFPQFMHHEKTCMCFMCLSLEFQRLLLENYHVNALLNMYNTENKVAEEFVAGAMALYKSLNRNYDGFRDKVSKLIPVDLISNFDDAFLEPYASILYDYSYHMRRKNLESEALQINTKLVRVLRPQKMKYVYLYHDALLQRLGYIVPNPQVTCADNKWESKTKLDVAANRDLPKTPPGRSTAITVTVNGIPTISPPKRRGKQCNLFGATSDSTKKSPRATKNYEERAGFAVPKLKGKKASVATPSTPFFGTVETPKIQIFTDDLQPCGSARTYSRKRMASARKQSSNEPDGDSVKQNGIEATNGDVDSFPPVVDPKELPVISGSSRKTRGQLLTQKIKESSTQNGLKAPSSRIRKNLVDELLKEKVPIPKTKAKTSPTKPEDDDSSLVPISPEHELAAARRKVVLEKMKDSAKKSTQTKGQRPKRATSNQTEVKKNLFGDFQDSETSSGSSKGTKSSTGALRKSTRNRVL